MVTLRSWLISSFGKRVTGNSFLDLVKLRRLSATETSCFADYMIRSLADQLGT